MALKWKSLDMNIDFEIICLYEVGNSLGSKIGRWYGLTFLTFFYDSEEQGENMV
jgi:hypothetical protein